MGISKRELMEDYYFDEIKEVIGEWNRQHDPQHEEEEEVSGFDFLGEGGERIGP